MCIYIYIYLLIYVYDNTWIIPALFLTYKFVSCLLLWQIIVELTQEYNVILVWCTWRFGADGSILGRTWA